MGCTTIRYKLDDGTTTSVQEVRAVNGLNIKTIRSRLNKSRDPAYIYSKIVTRTQRKYILTDGQELSILDIHDMTGICKSTISARFHTCKVRGYELTPERILGEITPDSGSAELKERIEDRMYQDRNGFWALFNKI